MGTTRSNGNSVALLVPLRSVQFSNRRNVGYAMVSAGFRRTVGQWGREGTTHAPFPVQAGKGRQCTEGVDTCAHCFLTY